MPGDSQWCSNYGRITHHGPFKTHAKYHCSKLGQTVVMNIWNKDAWQRQNTSPRQNHVISCHFQINYLIWLIVFCCYRRSLPPWYPLSNLIWKKKNTLSPLKAFLKANLTETRLKLHRQVIQWIHVYCNDYVLNNMVFFRRILLDTLMQICTMLRHLVAEISGFKFDNNSVIRTGASDLKLFCGRCM